jgi:protoporphyrinogen oxidase
MRVCVIGAGVAGLVCALRLGEQGHAVDVYERWPGLGGQAATLDVGDGTLIERYYHHWFTSDRHIVDLSEELGVGGRDRVAPVVGAFFVDGALRPFTTAVDLLRFTPLSPLSRVRRRPRRPAPASAAACRSGDFEGETARTWIEREMGARRGRTVGPAAARQVRLARRGRLDGLAARKLTQRRPRRQGGAQGDARLPGRLVRAAVRALRDAHRAGRRAAC